MKKIIYGTELRKKLKELNNTLRKTVEIVYGPNSRNVLLKNKNSSIIVAKDSATIMHNLNFEDKDENVLFEIIKEKFVEFYKENGDGTSSLLLILTNLINDSIKYIEAKHDPRELKRGYEKASKIASNLLLTHKYQLTEPLLNQLIDSILFFEKDINSLVKEVLSKMKHDGEIEIEKSNTSESYFEIVNGIQFKSGYFSPYFINNDLDLVFECDDCKILITNQRISKIEQISSILDEIKFHNTGILIICESIEGEALAFLVRNTADRNIQACAVVMPKFGEQGNLILMDLATMTNAKFFMKETEDELKYAVYEELGSAKKVKVDKRYTTIYTPQGDPEKIVELLTFLKRRVYDSQNLEEKEKFYERLTIINGAIAKVYVGGYSDYEIDYNKFKVESVFRIVKNALQEGVVINLPSVFLKIYAKMKEYLEQNKIEFSNETEKIAFISYMNSLKIPMNILLQNNENRDSIIKECMNNEYAYNFRTQSFDKQLTSSILNSYNSVLGVLKESFNILKNILDLECSITIIETKKKETSSNNSNEVSDFDSFEPQEENIEYF